MPLQNGLYKIEFQTQLGAGSGVVILHDGQLRGGDSMIYYVGTYKQDGDEFSAEVRTDAHRHPMQDGGDKRDQKTSDKI